MTVALAARFRALVVPRATTIAAFVLGSLPASVLACPVCRDPREDNQAAFLSMTIFMSLLPLSLIGGLIGYLWKSSQSDTDASHPSTGLTSREGGQS